MTLEPNKKWFMDRMADRNLSITSMSKALGVDKSAVSRALDGKRQVKALEVGKIAMLLGATREDVNLRFEGIATAAQRRSEIRAKPRDSRLPENPVPIAPDGFGEEQQPEIGSTKRPLHPGIGFMKGLIKFAPGFDGTGPYTDEPWEDVYLGEDVVARSGGKARSK